MNFWLGGIGLIPFVFLFASLLLTKVKSFIVGFATLALSIVLALIIWKATPSTVLFGALEGFVIALVPIVWVIFAAVFTYLVGVKTGAMDVIKNYLVGVTGDRNVQAVLITFCLGGFLESIAGFGTAVAIPTAILITLGYNPVKAAVLSLVANSVPVAFGALGIPVIVLSQITQLDPALLTRFVVIQLLPFSIFIPLALAVIANGGFRGIRSILPDILIIGVVFTGVQTCVAFFMGPELVAVAGSILSLAAYIVFKRLTKRIDREKYLAKSLFLSVSNYILLLILVLVTRLFDFPALKLEPFTIALTLGSHVAKIEWLTTPGTLLFVSAIVGGLIQGIKGKDILLLMADAANKIKFSALTILAIVALAKVMGYSGIIGSVAMLISRASGKLYPLIAPVLGALGTFVTGSDTSSNILLGGLQKETALALGLSPDWIAASNTAGATAGKMISPLSISVAASSVGIADKESQIMKQTLPFCVAYALILGIYVLAGSLFL